MKVLIMKTTVSPKNYHSKLMELQTFTLPYIRSGKKDVMSELQFRKALGIVGLCVLIAIVWGLSTLPIVFHFVTTAVS